MYCALFWHGFQVLEMKGIFYFSVSAIKLVLLYKVFSKFTVRPVIVKPCLVLSPQSCALGMEDLVLALLLNLASGLFYIFLLTLLYSRLICQQAETATVSYPMA